MTEQRLPIAERLRGALRALDRVSFGMIAMTALLLAILAFAILFFLPRHRSFVVEAETFGVEITFAQSAQNAWRLVNPIVCARLEKRRPPAPGGGFDDVCDSRLYDAGRLEFAEMNWPAGTTISVSRDGSEGRLELLVLPQDDRKPNEDQVTPMIEGKALPIGSRIVLDSADWARTGMLVFSGTAVVGSVPGPGVRDYMVNGRYEVWETLPLRPGTARIASGTLFTGDRTSVTDANGKTGVAVSGFLSPHEKNAIGEGFQVLVYSPLEDTRLRIDRLNTEMALVAGSWYQRVGADPWIIGVSAIIGFVAALLEFFRKLTTLRPPKRAA